MIYSENIWAKKQYYKTKAGGPYTGYMPCFNALFNKALKKNPLRRTSQLDLLMDKSLI